VTLEGVDYSIGPLSSEALRSSGLAFVCRYVSTPGNRKNLSAEAIADWSANGIGIVVVFEGVSGVAPEITGLWPTAGDPAGEERDDQRIGFHRSHRCRFRSRQGKPHDGRL
jgi:hypothetical protein